jgi:hypothetical protein
VQGLVNLGKEELGKSGLVVLEGAHLSSEKCPMVCPAVPPGCLIVWDSRLPHCNMPGQKSTRYCTYVSMQPRSAATQEDLLLHKQFFLAGVVTGHWVLNEPKPVDFLPPLCITREGSTRWKDFLPLV